MWFKNQKPVWEPVKLRWSRVSEVDPTLKFELEKRSGERENPTGAKPNGRRTQAGNTSSSRGANREEGFKRKRQMRRRRRKRRRAAGAEGETPNSPESGPKPDSLAGFDTLKVAAR